MRERAVPLTDQCDREAFFAVPLNREIERAFNENEWPGTEAGPA
jgi:hypothetical protein